LNSVQASPTGVENDAGSAALRGRVQELMGGPKDLFEPGDSLVEGGTADADREFDIVSGASRGDRGEPRADPLRDDRRPGRSGLDEDDGEFLAAPPPPEIGGPGQRIGRRRARRPGHRLGDPPDHRPEDRGCFP
jgi:hypothetical protein